MTHTPLIWSSGDLSVARALGTKWIRLAAERQLEGTTEGVKCIWDGTGRVHCDSQHQGGL
jgi:hypothetical protein